MTIIDAETFAALRDTTGGEFVRELIDTFLTEAPSMLGPPAGEPQRGVRAPARQAN